MEKFTWSEEYSVGVALINDQHKHFFEIANKIVDLVLKENVSQEAILKAAVELGDYAFYHMNTEEEYFKEFNYEEAEPHVNAHNLYREKVSEYLDKARAGNNLEQIAGEMAEFSGRWLREHIADMDKKYVDCFKEHGLS